MSKEQPGPDQSDYRALRLLGPRPTGPRTIGPSDYQAPGLSDPRTNGPPDYWREYSQQFKLFEPYLDLYISVIV